MDLKKKMLLLKIKYLEKHFKINAVKISIEIQILDQEDRIS